MTKKAASQSKIVAKLTKRVSQLSKERKKIAQLTRDIEQLRSATVESASRAGAMATGALEATVLEPAADGGFEAAAASSTPEKKSNSRARAPRSGARRPARRRA